MDIKWPRKIYSWYEDGTAHPLPGCTVLHPSTLARTMILYVTEQCNCYGAVIGIDGPDEIPLNSVDPATLEMPTTESLQRVAGLRLQRAFVEHDEKTGLHVIWVEGGKRQAVLFACSDAHVHCARWLSALSDLPAVKP